MAAQAADILVVDFEQGPEMAKYARVALRGVDAEVVEGGPDRKGHCLRIHNAKPSTACPLVLEGPIEVKKNLVLSFWHREEIEEGHEGAYLGMSWFVGRKQGFWSCDKFSNEWRHAQVQVGQLRGSWGIDMRLGLKLSRVQLYGRVKEKTKVRTATKARMTVWFDEIRLYTGFPKRSLSERTRVSYSNPPFFNWRRLDDAGDQKVQYSMNPEFAADATTTVAVAGNFHTPPAPMKPGTWFWRVWSADELSEGWSDIERVTILPEAHRFTTRAIPVDELARKPRPRLLDAAKIDRPEVTDERRSQLLRSAKRLYEQGVPEHPGPHVPGDPRWPTWIDWYGKVAGRITGGTGRKLQNMGRYAMLTKDAQVIQWAKEMALEACKWDPKGGSAMRRGDIGAHHLLRGLNWCYDACCEHMTHDERETLKNIIVERCNQFYGALNPFRGGEANNHAWLRAFGVAESGLVLLGDHEKAGEWAEYVRQLYLGRFLCCLGYQGDNNEGVAYWSYGLMFIVDYADLMKAVCGIDLFQHPWLNQSARFPMYCAPPNAWAVSFADSGMPNHGIRGPAATGQVRKLAVRTGDPYALWYSRSGAVDGIIPRPPVDLPQSIHYRHIGCAIFNTSLVDGREGVTVAMHSGPYYAGHQHPDQNHFVINAYGEKLAIDGGYYDWYGSPHFKAYSMTTLAHNTLLVDGEGQAVCKRGADGRIAAYFDSPGYGYTVGDAANPEVYRGKLKQFDRQILFIKPGDVIVRDVVAASKQVKLDWMLHAIVQVKLGSGNSFEIECDRAALRGAVLLPTDAKVEVKTGFPVEPVNRYSTDPVPKSKYFPEWTIHASPSGPVTEAEYLVPMQIQRLGDDVEPAAKIERVEATGAHAVQLTCGDRRHLALFRKDASQSKPGMVLKCSGLETDGNVAAIEIDGDGNVKRCMAIQATFLRWQAKTLLRSGEPKDMAWLDLPELKSGPITGARLDVNGKQTTLAGYQTRLPNEVLRHWWGAVELPRSDRYRIALDAGAGPAPRVRVGKREVTFGRSGKSSANMWLIEGAYPVTISGKGQLKGLRFDGIGVKTAAAVALPVGYKPAAGSLVVEAEKPSAEGKVKGIRMKKVAASRGIAHCCWDTEGQWAEWKFSVPRAGDYMLLVRGASVHDAILRAITLDGRPLAPGAEVSRFASTGGWCRTSNDWRYFRVADAAGEPVRVRLAPGKHTLRMEQLGGSMNVDLFAWRPVAGE